MLNFRQICTGLVAVAVSFGAASAQNRPFPTASGNTFAGAFTKPNTEDLNAAVTTCYNAYKAAYLKTASDGSCYILQAQDNGSGGTSVTTSEAHGYGMIASVLMAGYDANAHTTFDGMVKFYQNHPSNGGNNKGMNWAPLNATTNDGDDAATDGDMDIAYSLILADQQWGSTGTYNDLQMAKDLLNGMNSTNEFNYSTNYIGIADDDGTSNMTRTSDWIIDHLSTFAYFDATHVTKYTALTNEIHTLLGNGAICNSNTGLLPGFVSGTSPSQGPEDATEAGYGYNSCRDPWRLSMAWMHYGDANAKAVAVRTATWASGVGFGNIVDGGYSLAGAANQPSWGNAPYEYMGPLAVAATLIDQNTANAAWSVFKTAPASDVFGDGVKLMSMLAISGNWWNPTTNGQVVTNPTLTITQATGGTITPNPNQTTFTNGATVTLTAAANTGYVFAGWSGDISGATNPYTLTMNANKNVSAVFNLQGTSDDVNFASDTIYSSWEGDTMGNVTPASCTIGPIMPNNGVINGNYAFAYDTNGSNGYWLNCSIDGSLAGLNQVIVTYTSTVPVEISLGTTVGGVANDNCPRIYDLPAGTNKTDTVTLAEFTNPWQTWGVAAADTGTLILANDSSIDFAPVPSDNSTENAPITGTVSISKLLLQGITLSTGTIHVANGFSNILPKISAVAGRLSLSIPKSGMYHVSVYSVDGRQLWNQNTKLEAGTSMIAMPRLANGMYVAKVNGAAGSFSASLAITR